MEVYTGRRLAENRREKALRDIEARWEDAVRRMQNGAANADAMQKLNEATAAERRRIEDTFKEELRALGSRWRCGVTPGREE